MPAPNYPQSRENPGQDSPSIPSPYNFVPLAKQVFFPDWADRVSLDVPFREGISGILRVKVTARTPLYIRCGGAHDREAEAYGDFFRVCPGGPYAIPGTSLKGMLRGVLEIASFGKIAGSSGKTGRVSDHRYAVRDLQNRDLYTGHITEQAGGGYRPKVKAAWLKEGAEGWELRFCQFARVEQEDLEKHFGLREGSLGRRQGAGEKYRQISPYTELSFVCGPEEAHPHSPGRLVYRKADSLGRGETKGILVLTGQPSDRKPRGCVNRQGKPCSRGKHMEFLFFGADGAPVPVPEEVRKDFVFAHSELGENRKPNAEWAFWEAHLKRGKEIPVFVLLDPRGGIKSMGLALMYRLPYDHTILETIEHTSPDHLDGSRMDLGELIFGRVEDQEGLRGRVSVETLVAEGDPKPLPEVRTVLGAPKPTFYPNYVKQNDTGGHVTRYRTYMDPGAEIRGWKRYLPAADGAPRPVNPVPGDNEKDEKDKKNKKVATRFRPLPAETAFVGEIHLHNLKPQELGALLWALSWGGATNLRHGLGMAKPYGYGSVVVQVQEAGTELRWCDPSREGAPDPQACRRAFEELMESWGQKAGLPGGWRESPQIKALKALADPRSEWRFEVAYPVLGSSPSDNDFVQFKKNGVALLPPEPGKPGKKPSVAPTPRPPVSPVPPAPQGPEDEFLASIDKLSVGEVLKKERKLGLDPAKVPADKRRAIYQKLWKKPGGVSRPDYCAMANRWKP